MSVFDDILKKNNPPAPTMPAEQVAQGGGSTAAPTQFTAKPVTKEDAQKVVTPPTTPIVQAQQPQQPQQLSYMDMLNRMYTPETPEERAKRERKEKWNKTAAAIGDGISALANLYYTTKGAPNSYDGKNSMSERTRQLYEKMNNDRKENDRWYLNHYMNAAKMDEDARRYADERDYKRGRDAVADERYEYGKKRQETLDEEARKQRAWQNKRQEERDAVQDANTEWQHKFQENQAARQQANANRSYQIQKDSYERQIRKENPTVDFALGNGRKANIKKADINPQNVSYVYNKLPKEVRDLYATEQVYDNGKPVMTTITDDNGKKVKVPVMKSRKLTQDDMMVIIGEHIANYPVVQNAWKEVGGYITSSSATTNDNTPPSRSKTNNTSNDNTPPSRQKK